MISFFYTLFVFLLTGCAGLLCSTPAWHETGIMGDSKGILSSVDVMKNRSVARPFFNGEPLLVWICMPVDHLEFWCNDLGWVEDLGGPGYYSGFTVRSGRNEYDFTRSKFTGYDACIEDKQDWSKLIELNKNTTCFSAFFIAEHPPDISTLDKTSSWNIERIKSQKGEWSYEEGLLNTPVVRK